MAEPERIGLHNLKPAAGSRKVRKRIGRGEGSGTGKTAGRGQKGYGSRSGAKRRARFEGGQNPIHMRMRKLRGPHMKKSMPFEPFRTHTQPVNLVDPDARFDSGAEVTLAALRGRGLGTRTAVPVIPLPRSPSALRFGAHAAVLRRGASQAPLRSPAPLLHRLQVREWARTRLRNTCPGDFPAACHGLPQSHLRGKRSNA